MSAQRGKLRPADELKIQKNYSYLMDEIDAKDLTDIMFSRGVFDMDSLDEIKGVVPYTRKNRTEKFLQILMLSGPNSYKVFLESLSRSYQHVVKKLEATDVSNECQNISRDWFDDISDEKKKEKISEKDLGRLAQALGGGWELLALELNITSAQIEQAKMSNTVSPHVQIFNVLNKWKQRQGGGADFNSMLKALNNVKNSCTIDWEVVKRVVNEQT